MRWEGPGYEAGICFTRQGGELVIITLGDTGLSASSDLIRSLRERFGDCVCV